MLFRDNPVKLLDGILTDIVKIERFTQGADQTVFERDDQVAYAVKYALLRISEAPHRLGTTAAELCPDVAWRDVRVLGNRLRHAYDSIDVGLIWIIIEKDLVPLKTGVQAALLKLRKNEEEPQK